MLVDKDKAKHHGRASMTRSKSRQSLDNVPVPPDDKGGLKVGDVLPGNLRTNSQTDHVFVHSFIYKSHLVCYVIIFTGCFW